MPDAVTARTYVHVAYPWSAAIDGRAKQPARFYAGMVGQALRYGMPALRFGRLGAAAIRHGMPLRRATAVLKLLPRRPRPDIDLMLAQLSSSWRDLATRSPLLPSNAPDLSALALQRSAALTVFVFGEAPSPLLVCKIPRGDGQTVDLEVRALQQAERARVGPKSLGTIGDARVQEGLQGEPLSLDPLWPDAAHGVPWVHQHAALAEALERLAASTSTKDAPDEDLEPVERALRERALNQRSRTLLDAAREDLRRLRVSVLRHGDTSVQNCLFEREQLIGLVDWERAKLRGIPGFDVLNAAVAYLEQSLGLVAWSEEVALAAFETSWRNAPLFEQTRRAARRAAVSAGVPERAIDAVEVVFFGRRLGRRLADPTAYPMGPRGAAKMVDVVCAD